jgi:Fe2+ transport system protein FeoA
MTLDQSNKGAELEILEIRDEASRAQLMRFGISAGAKVICAEKLPMGPVILRKKGRR